MGTWISSAAAAAPRSTHWALCSALLIEGSALPIALHCIESPALLLWGLCSAHWALCSALRSLLWSAIDGKGCSCRLCAADHPPAIPTQHTCSFFSFLFSFSVSDFLFLFSVFRFLYLYYKHTAIPTEPLVHPEERRVAFDHFNMKCIIFMNVPYDSCGPVKHVILARKFQSCR